jgi:hypothetical protein
MIFIGPLLCLTAGLTQMMILCRQAPFGRIELAVGAVAIPHNEFQGMGYVSTLHRTT